jgi:hypothetical protein
MSRRTPSKPGDKESAMSVLEKRKLITLTDLDDHEGDRVYENEVEKAFNPHTGEALCSSCKEVIVADDLAVLWVGLADPRDGLGHDILLHGNCAQHLAASLLKDVRDYCFKMLARDHASADLVTLARKADRGRT